MTSLFACPECHEGTVDIGLKSNCSCNTCQAKPSPEKINSYRQLETQLKDYIRSLIECIDDCEASGASAETLRGVEEMIADPPGFASLAKENSMRNAIKVIRAKFDMVKSDLTDHREFKYRTA